MRLLPTLFSAVSIILAGVLFAGCDAAGDATGRVIIRMTDAPLEDVTEINVTIEACEIINSDTGERETITSTDSALNFNLLEYADGATLDVCDQEVQLTTFDQLRIVVGDDATIKIGEEDAVDLLVASGTSSGLKFFFGEPVSLTGETLDVTLDFVAEESVHATGPGEVPGYVMTPVIRVVTATVATQEVVLEEGQGTPQEAR